MDVSYSYALPSAVTSAEHSSMLDCVVWVEQLYAHCSKVTLCKKLQVWSHCIRLQDDIIIHEQDALRAAHLGKCIVALCEVVLLLGELDAERLALGVLLQERKHLLESFVCRAAYADVSNAALVYVLVYCL